MLQGIRVVELTVWVAGPAAGGVMADWGATVTKIEPPTGDPMRGFFRAAIGSQVEHNPPFDLDNRGKQSVCLDLRNEQGREAAYRILENADVFITNLRPQALKKLGMDPAELNSRFPRLIYASVTGYGLDGAERNKAGYDVGAFWARSGVAHLFHTAEQPPGALRGGFGDHVTGIATVAGILAALHERSSSGCGRVVETSLLRTGMYCIGWDLGIQLVFDKLHGPVPRDEGANPMVNCYRAVDDSWFWLIGVEGDRHFPRLCLAIDRPDLADDVRFGDPRSRRHNRRELIAELDAVFGTKTREQWGARFDAEEVWWVAVQTPSEVCRDPQAEAAGAFVDVPTGDGSTFRAIASPVSFHDSPQRSPGPVPDLGADTEKVLAAAGLSPEEIKMLLDARAAVGRPSQ
ncbi:MAG: crotonobetainyl-CoA:carnitine CoA-transferase CaiB-like acyl-CoA transferase [Hyphomicrobiaceae bacterium]|jgi:crotonobetainyl-CoA:carnitine CoA-transferase CaiB-like acyl-CoA transferase